MKFGNPYWHKVEKMDLLQRWIIVHSIIYYKLNDSIISDLMFDKNCQQLVEYKKKYKKTYKKSRYYYCMKKFDGSTGFDIMGKLTHDDYEKFLQIATNLINNKGVNHE